MKSELLGYSTDELAFLRQMDDRPDDLFLPLVYADWLDDQMDDRGPIMRLLLDRAKISWHGDVNHALVQSLTQEIDAAFRKASLDTRNWLATINALLDKRASVLNCGLAVKEPDPNGT